MTFLEKVYFNCIFSAWKKYDQLVQCKFVSVEDQGYNAKHMRLL